MSSERKPFPDDHGDIRLAAAATLGDPNLAPRLAAIVRTKFSHLTPDDLADVVQSAMLDYYRAAVSRTPDVAKARPPEDELTHLALDHAADWTRKAYQYARLMSLKSHSSPELNLAHKPADDDRARIQELTVAAVTRLSPRQRAVWESAVDYYRSQQPSTSRDEYIRSELERQFGGPISIETVRRAFQLGLSHVRRTLNVRGFSLKDL